MDNSRLSVDSLGESEVDLLREKLKQKERIINEKSEIINSLRQQVNDFQQEIEETENNQQYLQQRVDRLTKEVEVKNEEVESVSHALKEVEASYDKLTKRYEARTGQIQKFVEDLISVKKELESVRNENEQLKHKNERLTVELDLANSRKRSWQDLEQDKEEQQRQQQMLLDQQKQQQKQQLQRKPLRAYDENKPEPASALHFTMADEIGEIMDSSSALPPAKFVSDSSSAEWEEKQQRKHDIHNNKLAQTFNENSNLRPMRETLHVNDVNYCPNHRLKRSQFQQQQQQQQQRNDQNQFDNEQYDPIAEYKMRIERAAELARRNMLSKPLHQTSYPLELDTFNTTDLTEQEIKRGNVAKHPKLPQKEQIQQMKPPTRQPPQPPSQTRRQPLANFSNTPPRRVYKKAEAFIV